MVGHTMRHSRLLWFADAKKKVIAPPGPAWALYLMDEGAGQTLYDSSGNNRDMWLGFDGTVETSDPAWTNLGGVACLEFSGAQLCQSKTASGVNQPLTFIALARTISHTSMAVIVSRRVDAPHGLVHYSSTRKLSLILGTVLQGPVIPALEWVVGIGVANGASSSVWISGGSQTNGNAGTDGILRHMIGGRSSGGTPTDSWRGQIAAVAIIQGALSVSVAEQWATYLKAVKGVA